MDHKECTKCRQMLPLSAYDRLKQGLHGHRSWCKGCSVGHSRARRDDPAYRLLMYSRRKARDLRVPHTLKLQDIPLPERCPHTQLKLDYRPASGRRCGKKLDRHPVIICTRPDLGFIPGNITVLSWQAARTREKALAAYRQISPDRNPVTSMEAWLNDLTLPEDL